MTSRFAKITQIYQSMYEKIQILGMNDTEKEKYELQQYASDMLEHGNYETYFKMVKNGYQPNAIQEKMLAQAFLNHASKLVGTYGYAPDGDTLAQFILTTDYISSNSSRLQKDNENPYKGLWGDADVGLLKYVRSSLEKPEYQQAIYDAWKVKVTTKNKSELFTLSDDGAHGIFDLLKDVWFTDTSLADYKKIIKAVDSNRQLMQREYDEANVYSDRSKFSQRARNCLLQLSRNMSSSMSAIFEKTTDNVLEKTKQIYLNDAVDNLVVKSQYEKTKNYHIKNLPQEAQDIMMQIEKKYTRVGAIKNTLDAEKKFTVTNIMEQRLPEVVRKYFSIDDDYRTVLKDHEGKHAGDLLIDSLQQIHIILSDVLQQANEDKLTKMTVDNRYMHAVKKGS